MRKKKRGKQIKRGKINTVAVEKKKLTVMENARTVANLGSKLMQNELERTILNKKQSYFLFL